VVSLAVLVVGFLLGLSTSALTGERHPEIRAAQRALNQAEGHLKRAAHDYGGHRVKAMEHIAAAQQELREALAFDNK